MRNWLVALSAILWLTACESLRRDPFCPLPDPSDCEPEKTPCLMPDPTGANDTHWCCLGPSETDIGIACPKNKRDRDAGSAAPSGSIASARKVNQ